MCDYPELQGMFIRISNNCKEVGYFSQMTVSGKGIREWLPNSICISGCLVVIVVSHFLAY